MGAKYHDVSTRSQALTLYYLGLTYRDIDRITGICRNTLKTLYKRALLRGLPPVDSARKFVPKIEDRHVENAPKPGRLSKHIEENLTKILQATAYDRYGREKTCVDIASDLKNQGIRISPMTVWRILKASGMRKTKPTKKPGLSKAMRKARLDFCLAYQHWTLKDWKKVIWTDETSIVLGLRRGSHRVWRRVDEAVKKSCIRARFKGFSEFMFWGSIY